MLHSIFTFCKFSDKIIGPQNSVIEAYRTMQQDFNENSIAARIAEGDSHAEEYLFANLIERLQLMVRVRLRDFVPEDDQKDIVSEIQVAVLTSLRKGGYDPGRGKPLEAYIAGIAGNIVGQYFRRLKKDAGRETLDVSSIPDGEDGRLSKIIEDEQAARLLGCLNSLKAKYREILHLRIYENKSIEEISKDLNMERRRVSERIHYALRLLLKECNKDGYFQ